MSEWQPIETAPKDGTLIDVWVEPSSIRITDVWFKDGVWWETINGGFDHEMPDPPNHWMQVPGKPYEV